MGIRLPDWGVLQGDCIPNCVTCREENFTPFHSAKVGMYDAEVKPHREDMVRRDMAEAFNIEIAQRLNEVARLLQEQGSNPFRVQAYRHEGQIIVPVLVEAESPSLSLALLMARKADYLYKHTTCRFALAQRPTKDPKGGAYVWKDEAWHALP